MSSLTTRARGRPRRAQIESVRTIWWYWSVLERSGLSESKLEAKFDQVDRKELGLHRSTRWNKYKFGRSSPSAELLDAVETAYPGSRSSTYEHDLWTLASRAEHHMSDLLVVARRLPMQLRERLLPDVLPEGCAFWLRQDTDLSRLCDELTDAKNISTSIISVFCAVVLMGCLALHLQDEDLHFSAYRSMARAARWRVNPGAAPAIGLLVAHLIRGWIGTTYRDPTKQAVMANLKKVRRGPLPPWRSEQSELLLSTTADSRAQDDDELAKSYWIARQLAT